MAKSAKNDDLLVSIVTLYKAMFALLESGWNTYQEGIAKNDPTLVTQGKNDLARFHKVYDRLGKVKGKIRKDHDDRFDMIREFGFDLPVDRIMSDAPRGRKASAPKSFEEMLLED